MRERLKEIEKNRKRYEVIHYHAGHGIIMSHEATQTSLQVSPA